VTLEVSVNCCLVAAFADPVVVLQMTDISDVASVAREVRTRGNHLNLVVTESRPR